MNGTRPILDDHGEAKNPRDLTPSELLESILRWSALPGFSRHHWGTDFDIYDKSTLPHGYQVQLVPEEYQKRGPFFKSSVKNCVSTPFISHLKKRTSPLPILL